MTRLPSALLLAAALAARALAQRAAAPAPPAVPAPPVTVDRSGVLRWTADGSEVALFGVNYAAPFAYDFRAIRAVGGDVKHTIATDVAHLARLGVTAYRIHVWDKEVSDSAGNLLANEHLDHFDYLLDQLERRGIKVILTPIAWWGPGYPEPDPPSPGFANGHSKQQMAVDTVVRKAQARYLAQFVAHVNPYTNKSYRDDPDILAFEIFNEPWHDLSPPRETTRYINTLAAAMRSTGLRKPIFYNISEHFTPEHGQAVCAAQIQGITAQWYPTGLVRGATLPGNPLPNVDRYVLPWASFPGCRDKALMVYEFDGADVAEPVMYPAMARAFRGAGFQWATQFAYDPIAIAQTNTEYQTHYLNLAYAPAKAVSFLIAGEVFRSVPRGFDAGRYPASERFGDFRLSHVDRVSELVRDTMFIHAGPTRTAPPRPEALRHVAGVGASAVVATERTGAYFLDRLDAGIWRLEVYPDAVPVEDPFSRGNLRRSVTRLYDRAQPMTITLPDLGEAFVAEPLDGRARARPRVEGRTITVQAGAYLLVRAGVARPAAAVLASRLPRGVGYDTFWMPEVSGGERVVRHEPPPSVVAGGTLAVSVDVVQAAPPDSVLLAIRDAGWSGYARPARMRANGAYTYALDAPVRAEGSHAIEYVVTVFDGGRATTYPGAVDGAPDTWDFAGATPWRTYVEPAISPIPLFDADRDASRIVNPGYIPGAATRSDFVPTAAGERSAWRVGVDRFGATATHAAFRTMLRDGTRARIAAARADAARTLLQVRLRADVGARVPLEVALILSDGTAWGITLGEVPREATDVTIRVADLRRVPLVLIPRPYPTFLPYDLTSATTATTPRLELLEGIQWGFVRAPNTADAVSMRVVIESVRLVLQGAP